MVNSTENKENIDTSVKSLPNAPEQLNFNSSENSKNSMIQNQNQKIQNQNQQQNDKFCSADHAINSAGSGSNSSSLQNQNQKKTKTNDNNNNNIEKHWFGLMI